VCGALRLGSGQTGPVLSVAAINVAPVKALGLSRPDRIRLERDGVPEDRRLFLLQADGSVATLRTHPRLTSVLPQLDLGAEKLSLAFPDGSVTGSVLQADEPVTAELFGKRRTGRVVAGGLAEALSDFAGEALRLVLADRTGVGWDEGPASLLARASAERVGTPETGDRSARRYRMLFELTGAEPFEEDSWIGRRLCVGEALLGVTHALGRCLVINNDPDDGAKNWPGLRTLVEHRPDVTLGVIADVLAPGDVRVGDAVTLV